MIELTAAPDFIVTKEHRRFVEFCNACRKYRYIGLCYGPPGVGKTVSARYFTKWDCIQHLMDNYPAHVMPLVPEIVDCCSTFYTAPVANTPSRIEKEMNGLCEQFYQLIKWMKGTVEGKTVYDMEIGGPRVLELIVIDEVDRLRPSSLEQVRDLYDRTQAGVVLIGMPGIEKRLSRFAQLYSRVGFVHHFKPLSASEVRFILKEKWQSLNVTLDLSDFTDKEAVASVVRITNGNFRLLQRLLGQIERIMEINELEVITKEVVDAAREKLVIGP